MRYGSVCSGIEAATVAWHPLGWKPAFFSEIEAFPRAVLAHHYPKVPLHGDFTTIRAGEYDAIDLLVGGTPCQSFSIAGLRGGLDDDRGNLALEYLRLAQRLRPRWLVWENVPGVLSSGGGRDFGAILGGMVELGYGFAYRVLDAQFIRVDGHPRAVPQRRRRVFVVGYLGDWRRAAAVLFERESLSGHPAPRREAGKGIAGAVIKGAAIGREPHNGPQHGDWIDDGSCFTLLTNEVHAALVAPPIAKTLTRGAESAGKGGYAGRRQEGDDNLVAHALRAEGFDASEDGTGRGTPIVPVPFDTTQITSPTNRSAPQAGDPCHPLAAGAHPPAIAFGWQNSASQGDSASSEVVPTLDKSKTPAVAWSIMPQNSGRDFKARSVDVAQPVMAGGPVGGNQGGDYIQTGWAVRRLTPRECERLQGFPEITNELRILVCKSEDEKRALASSVASGSAAPALGPSAPVAVHVLIDLERQAVQLHSLGRSRWSASIADLADSSRLPMPADAFAHLAALTNSAVASSTRAGRAASQASIKPSSPALNGSALVALSGPEIAALASDAERFTAAMIACSRSITSQHGLTDPTCVSTWETLASCVAIAMTGFIPEAMKNACSYELRLTTHHGYTLIPHRKGMAADGPRYKALGNSMAVNVMRWIGQRIQMVEAITAREKAA